HCSSERFHHPVAGAHDQTLRSLLLLHRALAHVQLLGQKRFVLCVVNRAHRNEPVVNDLTLLTPATQPPAKLLGQNRIVIQAKLKHYPRHLKSVDTLAKFRLAADDGAQVSRNELRPCLLLRLLVAVASPTEDVQPLPQELAELRAVGAHENLLGAQIVTHLAHNIRQRAFCIIRELDLTSAIKYRL